MAPFISYHTYMNLDINMCDPSTSSNLSLYIYICVTLHHPPKYIRQGCFRHSSILCRTSSIFSSLSAFLSSSWGRLGWSLPISPTKHSSRLRPPKSAPSTELHTISSHPGIGSMVRAAILHPVHFSAWFGLIVLVGNLMVMKRRSFGGYFLKICGSVDTR